MIRTRVDRAVAEAVAAVRDEWLAFGGVSADADEIADLLYSLLEQCRNSGPSGGLCGVERLPSWKGDRPACDLDLHQRTGTGTMHTGVLVLTASRATAITNFLRRLPRNRSRSSGCSSWSKWASVCPWGRAASNTCTTCNSGPGCNCIRRN